MRAFLLRLLIVALGLWLATLIVPGVSADGVVSLLAAALILGVLNAVVRPLLVILTLPITLVTLGLFLLVINAALLGLVAWLFSGFHVHGVLAALFGSIVVSLTSWIGNRFIGKQR
jgi:putative membrane protein